jgi:hypothetical protein
MALKPDDTVCYCFHVSLRKIETFCKVQKPQVASQISDCLSAGTGCGWCVPMLKRIHHRCCGENIPWWRKRDETPATDPAAGPSATGTSSVLAPTAGPAIDPATPQPPAGPTSADLPDDIDAEAYAAGRANYIKQGKGKPPKEESSEF